MSEPITLSNLQPAPGAQKTRKRVGRGNGSGNGKTAGRGQKGQKSRSGSHNMRPGFEGGQMPLYMRTGKLRGPHMKKSMPMGPFRTQTEIANVGAIAEKFPAGTEVTPEMLVQTGLLSRIKHPVKILGEGDLGHALTIHAHGFSASAKAKIEAAGGTAVLIERSASAESE
ncbi:MAG: 50S ribosomal protein L15 [Actinobacteria bacterium]|jgi:large subunit ribosomal protein L15|nr:50S ribosomal protein L15 [Actinomycetota bacterium]